MRLWARRRRHFALADGDLPIVRVGPPLVRLVLGVDEHDQLVEAWEPDEAALEATCSEHGMLGQGQAGDTGKTLLGIVARQHAADDHAGRVQIRGWMA